MLRKRKKDPAFVDLSARFPRRVVARLDKLAKEMGISRNSLMSRLLEAATDVRSEQAAAGLFSILGVDELLKSAVQAAVVDAKKRLGVM